MKQQPLWIALIRSCIWAWAFCCAFLIAFNWIVAGSVAPYVPIVPCTIGAMLGVAFDARYLSTKGSRNIGIRMVFSILITCFFASLFFLCFPSSGLFAKGVGGTVLLSVLILGVMIGMSTMESKM